MNKKSCYFLNLIIIFSILIIQIKTESTEHNNNENNHNNSNNNDHNDNKGKSDTTVITQQRQQQPSQRDYSLGNYANRFPYSVSGEPEINYHQENNNEQNDYQQRQIPFNFVTNKNDQDSFNNYGNEETFRPKPVIKFSDEQLNLPNPYLINSNLPKDGNQEPCFYFPCKTNFGNEHQLIINNNEDPKHIYQTRSPVLSEPNYEFDRRSPLEVQSIPEIYSQKPKPDLSFYYQPNFHSGQFYPTFTESFSNINRPPFIPDLDYSLTSFHQPNPIPNLKKLTGDNDVTIICYGIECTPNQIRAQNSDNNQGIPSKSYENIPSGSLSNIGYSSEHIQDFQNKILSTLLKDLQFLQKPVEKQNTPFVNENHKINHNDEIIEQHSSNNKQENKFTENSDPSLLKADAEYKTEEKFKNLNQNINENIISVKN